MERERFDALVRLFATKGSRRQALTAILSAAVLGENPPVLAGRGKGKGRDHGKGRRKDHHDGKPGQRKDHKKHGDGVKPESRGHHHKRSKPRQKTNGPIAAEATGCCGAKSCNFPGVKSYSQGCNFAGTDLSGVNATAANLQGVDGRKTTFSTQAKPGNWYRVNFSRACLGGAKFAYADLRRANLSETCLIDADLSNAKTDSTTNFTNAVLCRTRMPNGSINNAGCGKATKCCPSCDSGHLCASGQVCCGGKCKSGACCTANDCATKTCQAKTCSGNQCQNTPISGNVGPNCDSICCSGVCCEAGEACNAQNQCGSGCRTSQDCGQNQVCCNGACHNGDCCTAQECGSSGNICDNFQCNCGDGPECSGNTPLCCGEGQAAT